MKITAMTAHIGPKKKCNSRTTVIFSQYFEKNTC